MLEMTKIQILFLDYSNIQLEECDIDDPYVHIHLDKLPEYKREHLTGWLKYRGDSLKSLDTMKLIRTRYIIYFVLCITFT